MVVSKGQVRSTRYSLSPALSLFRNFDMEAYFEKEVDERQILDRFNLDLIPKILKGVSLLKGEEENRLILLQNRFRNNIAQLSPNQYHKELERLTIDLGWKSSQIEGNTYSLLETEQLIKEKHTASGKPLEDATMLLNHKEAIDFILEHKDYVEPLTLAAIEDIHSILTKNLGVDRNIRQRRMGISGTNYVPLDNERQIREVLTDLCDLVNQKENVFEKALLVLALISYVQPFMDGNKRTARILANAILISHGHCPLSFRTVDSLVYKKAMLLFYEQNSLMALNEIFMDQYEFAVNTYF